MKPWREPFLLCIGITVLAACASLSNLHRDSFQQSAYSIAGAFPQPPRSIMLTNIAPPSTGGSAAVLERKTVNLPDVVLLPTVTTNADGSVTTCFPVGYFFTKIGRTVTNAFCVTNFPQPPPGLYLGWTQSNFIYGLPHTWWTNVLEYSTNAPFGPFTGRILIPCTNINMAVRIIINPNFPCFFPRLGTNLF